MLYIPATEEDVPEVIRSAMPGGIDSIGLPTPRIIPWPFRDNDALRAQRDAIGLSPLQADFVRGLAFAAWASSRPLRLMSLGLPSHATLDDALLACLRREGWRLAGFDDTKLDACWELRWEFFADYASRAAGYRPGASYHDRLRLELLLHAWERVAQNADADAVALDLLNLRLAQTSAAFSARHAIALGLLRRAAAERRAEAVAERRLRERLRAGLAELPADGARRRAIERALDGAGDLGAAIAEHGSESMRAAWMAHRRQPPPLDARAELEPRLARLHRRLWAFVEDDARPR